MRVSKRRKKVWTSSITPATTVAATTTANVNLFTEAEIANVGAATVLRIVGHYRVFGQTTTAGIRTGALGIMVVDNPDTGIVPVMRPIEDGSAEWMWWHPFTLADGTIGEAGSNRFMQEYYLDIRAGRKVEFRESLRLFVQNISTNPITFAGGCRILYALP